MRYARDGARIVFAAGTQVMVARAPFGAVGDLNCDGFIDNEDVDPFVQAVTDPNGYAATWPNCDPFNADINGDGVVDNEDIDPFVALLTQP